MQSVEKYKHVISTIQCQDFDQKIRYKILRIQEKESRFQAKFFFDGDNGKKRAKVKNLCTECYGSADQGRAKIKSECIPYTRRTKE